MQIVWQNFQEHYGAGSGAILSYQDYGERCFAKRHPHIDMTMNGWTLLNGKPALLKELELRGDGYQEIQETLCRRASVFMIDAEPGNLRVGETIESVPEYMKTLRYQMREMVDFTKVKYERETQTITWEDYHNAQHVETFTVRDFMAGLAEYQWRLKQWPQGDDKGMELHVGYGHMYKGGIRKTQITMGAKDQDHRPDCLCRQCHTWKRAYLKEAVLPPEPLDPDA